MENQRWDGFAILYVSTCVLSFRLCELKGAIVCVSGLLGVPFPLIKAEQDIHSSSGLCILLPTG
jgi:hypothetical protein